MRITKSDITLQDLRRLEAELAEKYPGYSIMSLLTGTFVAPDGQRYILQNTHTYMYGNEPDTINHWAGDRVRPLKAFTGTIDEVLILVGRENLPAR